jgi:hypothetical protein
VPGGGRQGTLYLRPVCRLRHVDTVFLDGYRVDGEKLRDASGLNGMPK